MKIAVIGSGISGLVSSYVLQKDHEVTLFEANSYLGGHTRTIDVEMLGKNYAIDTGFIVFNDKTYPNFKKFLMQIEAQWQDTEMSFSVFDQVKGFEYNGNNINTLFAQRKNIFKPKFYFFINEILKFNKLCKELERSGSIPDSTTLGRFLNDNDFSEFFQNYYLKPMAAAIWSSSYSEVSDFSLGFFIRFFSSHGLLNIQDRPQWHVIKGGSREYVRALLNHLQVDLRMNTPVQSVTRIDNGAEIYTSKKERFDQVIFACHSDQALKLIADITPSEAEVLGGLTYQKNHVTLHTDISLLPKVKRAWASWCYRMHQGQGRDNRMASVSYNMNILQGIQSPEPFIVSLNQDHDIDPKKIIKSQVFAHPVFSETAERAKLRRNEICGKSRTHFCGAYWYDGFHEDGVRSALDVADRFGASL